MIASALERVLTDHLAMPVACRAEPSPIAGGFWASIYGFELAKSGLPVGWSGRLVLRVMPNRERALHEIIVQRTVADSGFPTPRVLHDGFDEALGGSFMIMPFAVGRSPLSGLRVGSLLSLPRLLRRLPVQLADVALQLHALDPQPVAAALRDAGFGEASAESAGAETIQAETIHDGADSRLAMVESAVATDSSGFDDLLAWFAERRPLRPPLVLCHGDLHPFNLLVGPDGTTTVLDWTNGDLMPREFEVGFTAAFLRCAPISVPRAVRPALRRLTAWLAERFVSTYVRSSPLDHQRLAWFEALQYSRCLAEVATARGGLTDVVGADHPFETSAEAMTARLAVITGITVRLPRRLPAPAS
jgi:aminoglycoside phosphotransferase (APT) family kinase protein